MSKKFGIIGYPNFIDDFGYRTLRRSKRAFHVPEYVEHFYYTVALFH